MPFAINQTHLSDRLIFPHTNHSTYATCSLRFYLITVQKLLWNNQQSLVAVWLVLNVPRTAVGSKGPIGSISATLSFHPHHEHILTAHICFSCHWQWLYKSHKFHFRSSPSWTLQWRIAATGGWQGNSIEWPRFSYQIVSHETLHDSEACQL